MLLWVLMFVVAFGIILASISVARGRGTTAHRSTRTSDGHAGWVGDGGGGDVADCGAGDGGGGGGGGE